MILEILSDFQKAVIKMPELNTPKITELDETELFASRTVEQIKQDQINPVRIQATIPPVDMELFDPNK